MNVNYTCQIYMSFFLMLLFLRGVTFSQCKNCIFCIENSHMHRDDLEVRFLTLGRQCDHKEAPRSGPRAAKSDQERPKSRLQTHKSGLRTAMCAPGPAQDGSKRARRRHQDDLEVRFLTLGRQCDHKEASRSGPRAAKSYQERPKSRLQTHKSGLRTAMCAPGPAKDGAKRARRRHF